MKTKILGAVAVLAICSVVSPAYGASVGFIYKRRQLRYLDRSGSHQHQSLRHQQWGQVVGEYQVGFGGPVYGFLYRGHLYDAQ